jgi:hypothetical protein
MILLRLCEFSGNVQVLGGPPKSDEAQQMLKLNREVLNLVQSCQGMYQRMELGVSVMCQ